MSLTSRLLHTFSHHPYLVLILSVFVCCGLIAYSIARKKPLVIFAVLILILGILNIIWGYEWNDEYVEKNGVHGTGVVTEIKPTNIEINDVEEVEYITLLKLSDGRTAEGVFTNNGKTFYPRLSAWQPPSVGEVFSVKYIDRDPSNFIICTTDSSEYAIRILCYSAIDRLQKAAAKYQLDKSNAMFKVEYKVAIEGLLKVGCSADQKIMYKIILEQLGNR
jgi:hypothetical protein